MATKKQKHRRALERREAFLKTAHVGNGEVLQKAMGEAKRVEREGKIAKSKRLAKEHRERQLERSKSPNGVQINAQYAIERMEGM